MVSELARVKPLTCEDLAAYALGLITSIAKWLLGLALSDFVTSTFKKLWNRPKQHRVNADVITAHVSTGIPTATVRASSAPPVWL